MKKHTKFAPAITLLLCIIVFATQLTTGLAETISYEGGRNSFEGKTCTTREETEALESRLASAGYIIASGEGRQISDEDHQLFFFGDGAVCPYVDYANEEGFAGKMCKIYVYNPCYQKVLKALKTDSEIDMDLLMDIKISTVLIDYGVWYDEDRIGKVVNEYNDNVPEWAECGYLEITSPIKIIIRMESHSEHTYNDITVNGYTPTLIKIPVGGYTVTSLNSVKIDENEETLPYNNVIQIQASNTETNPYKIDLTKTVNEKKIPNLKAQDEAEQSTGTSQTEIDKQTAVSNQQQSEETSSFPYWLIIIICVVVVGGAVVFVIYKKKY